MRRTNRTEDRLDCVEGFVADQPMNHGWPAAGRSVKSWVRGPNDSTVNTLRTACCPVRLGDPLWKGGWKYWSSSFSHPDSNVILLFVFHRSNKCFLSSLPLQDDFSPFLSFFLADCSKKECFQSPKKCERSSCCWTSSQQKSKTISSIKTEVQQSMYSRVQYTWIVNIYSLFFYRPC